jgi:hypothetical protein
MLRMTSSKLLEATIPRCHDAEHDVITAAGGQDVMMLYMTSLKLLKATFSSCHDAGMTSSKLLEAALLRCQNAAQNVITAAGIYIAKTA